MKGLKFFAVIISLMPGIMSCNNQGNKTEVAQVTVSSGVNVYYFHFTSRCATCLAVEENARKAVETLYPNEVKAGDYSFSSLNLDESATKEIADKLGVGGQTMLVVHGEKKIDITSSVWMAAKDPEKMKEEIQSGINKVLF